MWGLEAKEEGGGGGAGGVEGGDVGAFHPAAGLAGEGFDVGPGAAGGQQVQGGGGGEGEEGGAFCVGGVAEGGFLQDVGEVCGGQDADVRGFAGGVVYPVERAEEAEDGGQDGAGAQPAVAADEEENGAERKGCGADDGGEPELGHAEEGEEVICGAADGEDGAFFALDEGEVGAGFFHAGVGLQGAGIPEGGEAGFAEAVLAVADVVGDGGGVVGAGQALFQQLDGLAVLPGVVGLLRAGGLCAVGGGQQGKQQEHDAAGQPGQGFADTANHAAALRLAETGLRIGAEGFAVAGLEDFLQVGGHGGRGDVGFDKGAEVAQEGEAICFLGEFVELAVAGAVCGALGDAAAQVRDEQPEGDADGGKVEKVDHPARQAMDAARDVFRQVAVDVGHFFRGHVAGGRRLSGLGGNDGDPGGVGFLPDEGDGCGGGLAIVAAGGVVVAEGEGGDAAHLCRGADEAGEDHAFGFAIGADDGFTSGGDEFPLCGVFRVGAFHVFRDMGAAHGDFHLHGFIHGQRFGGGGGVDAEVADGVGVVGGGAGGQGQGADGEHGQGGLQALGVEESAADDEELLAGDIGVAFTEGGEGAVEVDGVPALAAGKGGGVADAVVRQRGDALHGGGKGAYLDADGVELRGQRSLHAAGQEELDGGADGLVHIAVFHIGVPQDAVGDGGVFPFDVAGGQDG